MTAPAQLDRNRAIAIVETSRQTHADWLIWQETTPDWRSQVKPEDPGGPEHHRRAIEEYDLVLSVLRREPES